MTFFFSLSLLPNTHTHTHTQCVSSSVATGQAPTAKTSPQPMPIGTGGQAVRAFFEQQPAEPERSTLRSFSLSLSFSARFVFSQLPLLLLLLPQPHSPLRYSKSVVSVRCSRVPDRRLGRRTFFFFQNFTRDVFDFGFSLVVTRHHPKFLKFFFKNNFFCLKFQKCKVSLVCDEFCSA